MEKSKTDTTPCGMYHQTVRSAQNIPILLGLRACLVNVKINKVYFGCLIHCLYKRYKKKKRKKTNKKT